MSFFVVIPTMLPPPFYLIIDIGKGNYRTKKRKILTGSSNFPTLTLPRERIPHLLPTNGKHHIASLTPSHDNTQIISGGRQIIETLIAEGDDSASYDIAHPKHVLQYHAIFLNSSDVFFPNEGLEAKFVSGVVIFRNGSNGEDGREVVVI